MTDTREQQVRRIVSDYPAAPWYLRLPLVRHVRAIIATRNIIRHYRIWAAVGSIHFRADIDFAIRDAIWRGEK